MANDSTPQERLNLILNFAMQKGASDIHLKAGIFPVIRKHGVLRPLDKEMPRLEGDEILAMAASLMDQRQKELFARDKEIDLGYGVSGLGRFRINLFMQRGTPRMVIRNIPHQIPNFEELNLPPIIEKIAQFERGLVLVTGITGSGKSSTLAAMINYINMNKNKHILTLEDPIEFLIRDRKSLVTQRELGVDSTSYAKSLRAALRQDPDVIFVGEMRDKETMEIALTAAETGHLVFSTLHTMDARETVNRIVAAFDSHQQKQIRAHLGAVLKAVISQRLATRKDGRGFIPAVEVMVVNSRIRDMIENPDKTRQILDAIEESRDAFGMQSFDQSLMDLIQSDQITFEMAMSMASNPDDFAIRYAGVAGGRDAAWTEDDLFRKRSSFKRTVAEVDLSERSNTNAGKVDLNRRPNNSVVAKIKKVDQD